MTSADAELPDRDVEVLYNRCHPLLSYENNGLDVVEGLDLLEESSN